MDGSGEKTVIMNLNGSPSGPSSFQPKKVGQGLEENISSGSVFLIGTLYEACINCGCFAAGAGGAF